MAPAPRSSPAFLIAASSDELLGPSPAWLARRSFAGWSASPGFVGWVLWRHFDDGDAEEGKRLWVDLARRIRPPYDFVLDLRRLDSISKGAYGRIREFTRAKKPGLRRFALLVGGDTPGGAIQVGLFTLSPPAFDWQVFHSSDEAARWLGTPGAVEVLREVDRLAADPSDFLAAVWSAVKAAPHASMGHVSRRLGSSSRSLQRRLEQHRTSFLELRARARIELAQDLLRDPNAKLEAVAAAVGCSDRRTLNRLFKRITGESPAKFRSRR